MRTDDMNQPLSIKILEKILARIHTLDISKMISAIHIPGYDNPCKGEGGI